jgi:hypothetical protein
MSSQNPLLRAVWPALVATLLVAAPAVAQSYAHVTLEMAPEDSECASVDPDSVVIYTAASPSAVQWTVTGKSTTQAWVMEYANDKPGASAPSFGASYTIPCGTTYSVTSMNAMTTGLWIYRVKVYDCVSGVPYGSPVCEVDPEVIINEEPPGDED